VHLVALVKALTIQIAGAIKCMEFRGKHVDALIIFLVMKSKIRLTVN
jgi:hypothetical protein